MMVNSSRLSLGQAGGGTIGGVALAVGVRWLPCSSATGGPSFTPEECSEQARMGEVANTGLEEFNHLVAEV